MKRIAQKYSLELLLLFGSRAEKNNKYIREDSDFDIAYLPSKNKNLDLMDEARLAGDLAKVFKTSDIDIVNLKRSSPLLMKQIFDNHVVLFCGNETTYSLYQIYAIKKFIEAKSLFKIRDIFTNNFLKEHGYR